jgi:ammonia channel protein AmtB
MHINFYICCQLFFLECLKPFSSLLLCLQSRFDRDCVCRYFYVCMFIVQWGKYLFQITNSCVLFPAHGVTTLPRRRRRNALQAAIAFMYCRLTTMHKQCLRHKCTINNCRFSGHTTCTCILLYFIFLYFITFSTPVSLLVNKLFRYLLNWIQFWDKRFTSFLPLWILCFFSWEV